MASIGEQRYTPPMPTPTPISMRELLARHDGVLLDAYGVLVDGSGALPGARALIDELTRRGTPYAIVTNDASRSRATLARRFAGFGLAIPAERCFTSGVLLTEFLREEGFAGKRALVLGPDDSRAYVAAAGVELVPLEPGVEIDLLCVCDDAGYDFLRGADIALSAVLRALAAGRPPGLVLPNPDLVYPKSSPGTETGATASVEYGFTAGALALMLEAGIARRYPTSGEFVRLGKPEPELLELARRELPGNVVMIGDQLETDIAAANAAGIPSALVAGVSTWTPAHAARATPTYLLASLAP